MLLLLLHWQKQARGLLTAYGLSDLYDPSLVDESEVFRRLDYLGVVLTDAVKKGWLEELPPNVESVEDIDTLKKVLGFHGGVPPSSKVPTHGTDSKTASSPSPILLSELWSGSWQAQVCTFPVLKARERKPSVSSAPDSFIEDLFP